MFLYQPPLPTYTIEVIPLRKYPPIYIYISFEQFTIRNLYTLWSFFYQGFCCKSCIQSQVLSQVNKQIFSHLTSIRFSLSTLVIFGSTVIWISHGPISLRKKLYESLSVKIFWNARDSQQEIGTLKPDRNFLDRGTKEGKTNLPYDKKGTLQSPRTPDDRFFSGT